MAALGRSAAAVSPRRRPGRPPIQVGGPPARVHCTLPSRHYDRAYALARREGVSVPEVLRRGLARVLAERAAR